MTKYHFRRWLIMLMQRLDWSEGRENTLNWAIKRGWVGSHDQKFWYMRDDEGNERI